MTSSKLDSSLHFFICVALACMLLPQTSQARRASLSSLVGQKVAFKKRGGGQIKGVIKSVSATSVAIQDARGRVSHWRRASLVSVKAEVSCTSSKAPCRHQWYTKRKKRLRRVHLRARTLRQSGMISTVIGLSLVGISGVIITAGLIGQERLPSGAANGMVVAGAYGFLTTGVTLAALGGLFWGVGASRVSNTKKQGWDKGFVKLPTAQKRDHIMLAAQ